MALLFSKANYHLLTVPPIRQGKNPFLGSDSRQSNLYILYQLIIWSVRLFSLLGKHPVIELGG